MKFAMHGNVDIYFRHGRVGAEHRSGAGGHPSKPNWTLSGVLPGKV